MARRPRHGAAFGGEAGNSRNRSVVDDQVHAVQGEEVTVLLEQCVLRFGQHASQLFFVELAQGRDDRQAANQLGDDAVVRQVLGHDLVERVLHGTAQLGAKTDTAGTHAGRDAVVNIVEGTSHDEENVRGINLNVRVRRMLAAVGRRSADGAPQ